MKLFGLFASCFFAANSFGQVVPTIVQDYCPGACPFAPYSIVANGKLYISSGGILNSKSIFESDGFTISVSPILPSFPLADTVNTVLNLVSANNYIFFNTLETEVYGSFPPINYPYVYVSNGVAPAVPLMRNGQRVRANLSFSPVVGSRILLSIQPSGDYASAGPQGWFFYDPSTGTFDSLKTPLFTYNQPNRTAAFLDNRLYWISRGGIAGLDDKPILRVHDLSASTTTYDTILVPAPYDGTFVTTSHGNKVYAAMSGYAPGLSRLSGLFQFDSSGNVSNLYQASEDTRSFSNGIASYGPFVLFIGYDAAEGRQILKYEPSSGSIMPIPSLDSGPDSGAVFLHSRNNINGLLFFGGYSKVAGPEIYAYDWGKNVTTRLTDLLGTDAIGKPDGYGATSFTGYGGKIYFAGQTPAMGYELYSINSPLITRSVPPASKAYTLFPNPVSSTLALKGKADNTGLHSALITDPLGRTLLSHPFTGASTTISVETLPSGTYFLSILEDGRRTATATFVKL